MAALYIMAGMTHLVKPKPFLKITPKWVPLPNIVNIAVGCIEILLGIGLLLSSFRSVAASGIILLLIAVFPANIYHFQLTVKKKKMMVITLLRLPLQVILIYWAYLFIE